LTIEICNKIADHVGLKSKFNLAGLVGTSGIPKNKNEVKIMQIQNLTNYQQIINNLANNAPKKQQKMNAT